MKKTLITLLFAIPVFGLFAQRYHDFSFPYETGIKTIQFKVLDINFDKNIVAFKHIYEMQECYIMGEEGEVLQKPIDCAYAGMESYPKAGVVLGMYDLAKGEYLKTFTVYESCYESDDCYSHERSVQALDSAKQLFKDYGMTIEKCPKPIFYKKEINGTSSLTLDGIKFTSSFQNDRDNMATVSTLYANGTLLFTESFFDNFVMASHGEVLHTAAYKEGDRIVFLSKFFHTNHMEGVRSWEFFQFSPVFVIMGDRVVQE
jgi:hypothetical protein